MNTTSIVIRVTTCDKNWLSVYTQYWKKIRIITVKNISIGFKYGLKKFIALFQKDTLLPPYIPDKFNFLTHHHSSTEQSESYTVLLTSYLTFIRFLILFRLFQNHKLSQWPMSMPTQTENVDHEIWPYLTLKSVEELKTTVNQTLKGILSTKR